MNQDQRRSDSPFCLGERAYRRVSRFEGDINYSTAALKYLAAQAVSSSGSNH